MSDLFAPQANARQPDSTYLAALEKRLKAVKDKEQIDSKTILKDIKSLKNDQLFNFLTEPEKPTTSWETFDDDSLPEDKPIKPSIIRQKVAPQTCAINKNELAHILKYDLSQKLFDFYNQLDESQADRKESQEILQELKELANVLEHQKLEDSEPNEETKADEKTKDE
ncbi:hypothetical protein L3Y34_007404 [Caenorhabditis briggsae]|uniref:Uncharacterized protein n=1 Tax=Caenorhabditis briggsae TaxID=6238 RepID=A0AAE9D0U4_CAEBR|nr:hypothetical protein L3Y34_007404 [Caenorhabditis briggsae]